MASLELSQDTPEIETLVSGLKTAIANEPNDPRVREQAASALIERRMADQAEEILQEAVRRFPEDLTLNILFAKVGGMLALNGEEARRWNLVQTAFPKQVSGYLGASRVARRERRLDESEVISAAAIEAIGPDRRLLIEQAMCAVTREDWPVALQRWQVIESQGELDASSYAGMAMALMRTGNTGDAEIKLKHAAGRFPDDIDIQVRLADLETAKEQWGVALDIWQALLKKYPRNQRIIDGLGAAKWRYNLHAENADAADEGLSRPVDVGLVEDARLSGLVNSFESLGQDCEFGLVQRHFGAEPLSLLRWTTTKPDTLIRGLRGSFEGLGDLENTHLDTLKHEIMVNDMAYRIRFHTFIQRQPEPDLVRLRIKQAAHLRYLRNVFIERLKDGEKVYVYKGDRGLDNTKIDEIYQELQKHTTARLVAVKIEDEQNAAGSVAVRSKGCFIGYLSRFGLDRSSAWNIDFVNWIKICQSVIDAS